MTKFYESMSDALPDIKRVKEIKKDLISKGVKYIYSNWIDFLGSPKTKPMPIDDFENLCMGKGPQFAVHSVSFVPELTPADNDQIPVPDLDSLVICPWDKSCAWVFSDLFWNNKPYNVCPRMTLKKQIEKSAQADLKFYVGIEPEFFLMKWDGDKPVKAIDLDPIPLRRQAFGYDTEYSINGMHFLKEIIDILNEDLGWELHDVVAEGAYGQYELDFGYTDILQMADRFVFLRVLLKEIAKKHGYFVTFMPKTNISDWRSGAHINHSVASIKTGNSNIYKDGENFSDKAYNAVAGILKHGAAITALACPTVNSYNGFVSSVEGLDGGLHTWAPTHMTYGSNNRSAMIRLPQNRFCIENRASDLTQNPYLTFSLLAASVTEGIQKKLKPPAITNKSLYDLNDQEQQEISTLPRNLLEAVDAFKKDPIIYEVFSDPLINNFVSYKYDEWRRYHTTTTDWEIREYLKLF